MAIDPEEIRQILESIKCTEKADKKINFFQYINTVILTIIGIVAIMIFISNTNIRKSQQETSIELIRMKTIQDINTANIMSVDKRVTALEINSVDYIKTWIEDNFIRKTSK